MYLLCRYNAYNCTRLLLTTVQILINVSKYLINIRLKYISTVDGTTPSLNYFKL